MMAIQSVTFELRRADVQNKTIRKHLDRSKHYTTTFNAGMYVYMMLYNSPSF